MFKIDKRAFSRIGTIAVIGAGFALAACSETYSRNDFASRVKDKSDAEVTQLVGKPSRVDTTTPDRVTWTYYSRTFNPEARNKADTKAVVVFSKAPAAGGLKATEVVFE